MLGGSDAASEVWSVFSAVLLLVWNATALRSYLESNCCSVVRASLFRFIGETCLGEGKMVKADVATNAPAMIIMTIRTSIVRIMGCSPVLLECSRGRVSLDRRLR